MAIGRIAGPLLYSDLDRQGVDLQFSTNNQPLLYLDFANFKAAINSAPTDYTFTVNGNVALDDIRIVNDSISSTTGAIHLGHVQGLKITGGADNFIMTTDGAGNLAWKDIATVSQDLNLSASDIVLGDAMDQSVTDYSAYRYWDGNTPVTDAIDNLNQVVLNVYQGTYVGAVDFNASIIEGPSPLTVQFTSTHLGNPDTYYWDFGDESTSNQQNPIHTYDNEEGGIYTVYFKASNTQGTLAGEGNFGQDALGKAQGSYADKRAVDYITMFTPLPVAQFSLTSPNIDSGNAVVLINTSHYADSYVVFWGDGTTTTVPNNTSPGGPQGTPLTHVYTNMAGDSIHDIYIEAFSSTSGPSGTTVASPITVLRVYSLHTPTMTATPTDGNNQHAALPNGLHVTFTNTTGTHPGETALFPSNLIEYVWGDGTATQVIIGSGQPGDLGLAIMHPFTLTDPTVEQIFNVTMRIFNGHSGTQPFTSSVTQITVHPAPTALFGGAAIVASDRTGDSLQTGYIFTDLDGVNRATIVFNNSSLNADSFEWSFGDGVTLPLTPGDQGTPTGGPLQHTYGSVSVLPYTVSLLSHGPSSISSIDDTLTKPTYIEIKDAPIAPAGLSTNTIDITTVGSNAYLVADATNRSISSIPMPSAGSIVKRVTTAILATTNVIDVYNADNGVLSAYVNGAIDGTTALTGNNDTGTTGALVISADKDAHAVWPSIYPSRFYNVFSANISKANGLIDAGYNTYKMTHSITGDTNELGFVKDDVIVAPTLNSAVASATTQTPGTLRYISGVPYFSSGGSISLHGISAFNWIGQTYLGPESTVTPFTVVPGSVSEGIGTIVTTQSKTYAQIDGVPSFLVGGIPQVNTGKTSGSAYTLGSITVNIDGVAALSGKLKVQLSSINGSSPQVEIPTLINLYSIPTISGFDETSIPVSANLGGAYTDNGKRIVLGTGVLGATPLFNAMTNYYVNNAFIGPVTVQGSDESIVRFGTLAHNTNNYSLHLPVGPDLGGRAGTQYFRFAFRRSTVANFMVTYTGKISGLWVAAPGTNIDVTSSMNGWLDGSQVYAGAGIPGENVAQGGNGNNGCAKSSGDVITNAAVVNQGFTMTLGSENSSDATGNQIFVSIALNAGDSLTSISIS